MYTICQQTLDGILTGNRYEKKLKRLKLVMRNKQVRLKKTALETKIILYHEDISRRGYLNQ